MFRLVFLVLLSSNFHKRRSVYFKAQQIIIVTEWPAMPRLE